MIKNSFIFLGDLLDIKELSNLTVIDDYKIRCADELEIEYIKERIDNFSIVLDHSINRFEVEKIQTGENQWTYEPLEKNAWNYLVIESPHINEEKEFSIALSLSKVDLAELFSGHYQTHNTNKGSITIPSLKTRTLSVVNFFIDNMSVEIQKKKIIDNDIVEIKTLYHLIKNVYNSGNKEHDFINKCLTDYLKVREISDRSPFKILSHFSIIEHLLTINKQQANSINHQLQKKLNLLNNQFDIKIDTVKYFKSSQSNSFEDIIKTLYQYRSDIAHGNKSDFEKKLKIISDGRSYERDFLRELLKRTLICSLNNVELIKDLREC